MQVGYTLTDVGILQPSGVEIYPVDRQSQDCNAIVSKQTAIGNRGVVEDSRLLPLNSLLIFSGILLPASLAQGFAEQEFDLSIKAP